MNSNARYVGMICGAHVQGVHTWLQGTPLEHADTIGTN